MIIAIKKINLKNRIIHSSTKTTEDDKREKNQPQKQHHPQQHKTTDDDKRQKNQVQKPNQNQQNKTTDDDKRQKNRAKT